MTESNKKVMQFGLIFIVGAIILYTIMAGRQTPPGISGHAQIEAGNMKTALQSEAAALKASLEGDPHNVNTIIKLANVYYDLDMPAEAIKFYEQALAIQPDDPSLMTDCAVMYHNVGESDKALNYLDKVITLKPDLAQAYFNKGIILMSAKGDADGAIATWREFIKINPESEEALFIEQQIEAIITGHEMNDRNPR